MALPKNFTALGVAASLATACAVCHAQAWPSKPIRMLVGFPAGGPTDVVARIVSEKLAGQINQRIVVDNRPGAAGNIAVEILTKSNADGHTLLYSSNAIALSPGLYSKLGYDPNKDLAPITEIGAGCLIFVVHPSLPVKTSQEFIDYAKARPGQLNYASSGAGTSTHLAAVLFSQRTGIQTQHVPYKGTAPSLVDMIAGRTQFLMGAVLTAVPHVQGRQAAGARRDRLEAHQVAAGSAHARRVGAARIRGDDLAGNLRARGHCSGGARAGQRGIRQGGEEPRVETEDRAAGHGSDRAGGEGVQHRVLCRARALDQGGEGRRPQGRLNPPG